MTTHYAPATQEIHLSSRRLLKNRRRACAARIAVGIIVSVAAATLGVGSVLAQPAPAPERDDPARDPERDDNGPVLPPGLQGRDQAGEEATQVPDGPDDNDGPDDQDSDQPVLPPGLGGDDSGPSLPPGLGGDDSGPSLPPGVGDDDSGPSLPPGIDGGASSAGAEDTVLPIDWRFAVDMRAGSRLFHDAYEDPLSLWELRMRLDMTKSWRPWSTTARLVVDGIGDLLAAEYQPHIERGEGAIDLRVASLTLGPNDHFDLRIGRQSLTWGTGDLLFINDLFPKDWVAFLIGRDVEYLKAPTDAIRAAFFTSVINLDVVFTPRFEADRIVSRDRLSSWEPSQQRVVGQNVPIVLQRPDDWLDDAEWAVRAHRRLGSWELAGYGYHGFWKSPAGVDAATGAATFPALSVYGASVRGPIHGGIAHAEVGFYDSRDDRDGDDPLVRNSETRGLVGYERPLSDDVVASVQYYAEIMRSYDGYASGLPPMYPAADEVRHVITGRLHWLALSHNLQTSLFIFASPSDRDGYLRPVVTYAVDDHWRLTAGANLLFGADEHTFFGQLENNTNVYAALHYSR